MNLTWWKRRFMLGRISGECGIHRVSAGKIRRVGISVTAFETEYTLHVFLWAVALRAHVGVHL